MSEQTAEKDATRYLVAEWQAVVEAQHAYLDALDSLQATCAHPTILMFTSSEYRTSRVCEECGYTESVQWDSPYKYKDQRLLRRAYDVSWNEYYDALPKVRESSLTVPRVTPPGSGQS